MKDFSQFLQESYLNEGVAPSERRPARKRRSGGPTPEEVKAQINAREAEKAQRRAQRKPSGAAARPDLQFKKSTVQSPATPKKASGAARDPWNQFPKKPQKQLGIPKEGPSSQLPGRILEPTGGITPRAALPAKGQTQRAGALATRSTSTPSAPVGTPSNPERIYPTPVKNSSSTSPKGLLPAKGQTGGSKSSGLSTKPIQQIKTDLNVPTPKEFGGSKKQLALPAARQTGGSKSSALSGSGKPPTGTKPTGKFGKALKVLGPASAALDTALSTADERAKGSGWARSLAKGATVAAGGLAGGALGALGGGGIGSAALGTAGAIGGAELAGRAFDTAAGANAKERAAMAKANRQRQAGTAIKGIGGKTTFDTKKNTITTGTGSQRKTVGLAKTGVVQRGGQSVAGHLAYKGGKAVYKAGPSAQSLAKTSSNPLERIGRSLFAGAYKKSDAANAAKKLATARQNDAARNKALGVKALPGK
jgi:hypothetical protein